MDNEYYKQLLNIKYKFNDNYKLMYLTNEQYNLIDDLLSKLRRDKFFSFDQYYRIKNIYKHYHNNFYKIKQLDSKQPRTIAQKFIGKKNIREFIFKRDGYMCLKCKKYDVKLTIDHINPINKNGCNKIGNLQTLCISCNSKKSDNYKDYRNGAR